jgi:YVTN family beta-propeller protein
MRKPRSKRYVGSLLAGWGLMCASLWWAGSAGAQACDNLAFVTDWTDNLVQVVDIDATGQQLVASIPVGNSPVEIAALGDGSQVYVSNQGSNSVSVIDTGLTTGVIQKIADVAVGESPEGLAVRLSRVYVANTGSDTVSVIDKDQLAVVATIGVGHAPGQIAANPSTNSVYVTNRGSGTVSVIDCSSNTVTGSVDAGKYPRGIAVSPDGSMLAVANVSDGTVGWRSAGGSLYGATTVGAAPYNILISPSSWAAFVANADDGTVSMLYGSYLWQTINTWLTIQVSTIQTGAQWGPYNVALTTHGGRLLVPTFSGGTLNVYSSEGNDAGQLKQVISLGGTPRAVAAICRPVGS